MPNRAHLLLYQIFFLPGYAFKAMLVWITKEIEFRQIRTRKPWSTIWTLTICTRTQSAFTCSKLTIETLEQGVKHVQS